MPDDEEDVEEAVLGNTWSLDNLAEGFHLFKTVFGLFYDVGPSRIWALKLKQTVSYIFRGVKKLPSHKF